MEEYKKMWKNFGKFEGRSTRRDYWMAVLFNVIASFVLSFVAGLLKLPILVGIYSLAVIIPSLSLAWRRFHDTNRSGAWFFIALVPFVGWIIELVILCQPSVNENNKYGEIVE